MPPNWFTLILSEIPSNWELAQRYFCVIWVQIVLRVAALIDLPSFGWSGRQCVFSNFCYFLNWIYFSHLRFHLSFNNLGSGTVGTMDLWMTDRGFDSSGWQQTFIPKISLSAHYLKWINYQKNRSVVQGGSSVTTFNHIDYNLQFDSKFNINVLVTNSDQLGKRQQQSLKVTWSQSTSFKITSKFALN